MPLQNCIEIRSDGSLCFYRPAQCIDLTKSRASRNPNPVTPDSFTAMNPFLRKLLLVLGMLGFAAGMALLFTMGQWRYPLNAIGSVAERPPFETSRVTVEEFPAWLHRQAQNREWPSHPGFRAE